MTNHANYIYSKYSPTVLHTRVNLQEHMIQQCAHTYKYVNIHSSHASLLCIQLYICRSTFMLLEGKRSVHNATISSKNC